MPRKAKENEELKDLKKTNTSSRTTTKKTTTAKATSKSITTTTTKKTPTKKSTKSSTQKKTSKSNTSTNKSTTKSTSTKRKATTSKSSTSDKKAPLKKSKATKSSSTKRKTQPKDIITEYYDLPQKYNQTVVKILAQTPKTIFIYWEISDDDIIKYKNQYGEDFFEKTKPVLIIHNITLNYSFEVDINDFANSWYLHTNDSKSEYKIELGRRPIVKDSNINMDYIFVSSSNEIETPNDHILFNTSNQSVYFRNVKTNQEIQKSFTSFPFMKNMGKIYDVYDIYDLYEKIYKNEYNLEYLSNPSSQTSSQFK